MRAYRFLAKGAVGRLSGFAWPTPKGPEPGAWVGGAADATAIGVFAHRDRDLPYWIDEELWEVELKGDVRELANQLVAEDARLLRMVPGWNERTGVAFATACVERLRKRAIRVLGLHGLTSLGDKLEVAPLADCARLLQTIQGGPHGEIPVLAAGYLIDAIGALAAKLFGTVAYIVHVASVDARLLNVDDRAERDLQAEWLKGTLDAS